MYNHMWNLLLRTIRGQPDGQQQPQEYEQDPRRLLGLRRLYREINGR